MPRLSATFRRVLLALALVWAGLLLACAQVDAQALQHLAGSVRDSGGRPVAGAVVTVRSGSGETSAATDRDGRFQLDLAGGTSPVLLRAVLGNLQSEPLTLASGSELTGLVLVVRPSAEAQQVTVTATRSSADMPATANTLYALDGHALASYPAYALDDKLRQQAGFELFRRSPSRVQNPTSQGISLRGLGSTAASRSLVLEDGVPLNDPFGGWIHWDELPVEAVEAVTIATGGGSDLYGSSALGGVIDVVPARPSTPRLEADAQGGGQATSAFGLRGDAGDPRRAQLLAADWFRTGGYIPTDPALAGPVDRAANLHDESVRSETDLTLPAVGRVFLVGNVLNEARGNGTSLQTNGTRLWRYIAGSDWKGAAQSSGRVRLFGSDEAYRQSFSAINAARITESLTRLQQVRTQELGGSTDASVAFRRFAVVTGFDVRDIRATDDETPVSAGVPSGVADTSARQRFAGGFVEALASRGGWSGALSLRLDSAVNLDTRVLTAPSAAPQPVLTANRSEFIPSPRLGLVRQLGAVGAIHASAFRAFRTPTMNELYRTGQVGQETTQANPLLASERATGWELGGTLRPRSGLLALSATYFWTEINRPVSAVLISSTATTIVDKRQNLGQILSEGMELHLEVRSRRAISGSVAYQYAHATVTRFSAQPGLVGNWIPQVPRQSVTAQIRGERERLGEVTLALRASGHAFDDSANTYVLRSFAELDVFARHAFGAHWTVSVTVQNLLNQRPDVARTPILTLGSGVLAQAGVAYRWGVVR